VGISLKCFHFKNHNISNNLYQIFDPCTFLKIITLNFFSVAKPGIPIPQTEKVTKFIPHSPKEVSGKFSEQETKWNGKFSY
jgi:hypothetical protein